MSDFVNGEGLAALFNNNHGDSLRAKCALCHGDLQSDYHYVLTNNQHKLCSFCLQSHDDSHLETVRTLDYEDKTLEKAVICLTTAQALCYQFLDERERFEEHSKFVYDSMQDRKTEAEVKILDCFRDCFRRLQYASSLSRLHFDQEMSEAKHYEARLWNLLASLDGDQRTSAQKKQKKKAKRQLEELVNGNAFQGFQDYLTKDRHPSDFFSYSHSRPELLYELIPGYLDKVTLGKALMFDQEMQGKSLAKKHASQTCACTGKEASENKPQSHDQQGKETVQDKHTSCASSSAELVQDKHTSSASSSAELSFMSMSSSEKLPEKCRKDLTSSEKVPEKCLSELRSPQAISGPCSRQDSLKESPEQIIMASVSPPRSFRASGQGQPDNIEMSYNSAKVAENSIDGSTALRDQPPTEKKDALLINCNARRQQQKLQLVPANTETPDCITQVTPGSWKEVFEHMQLETKFRQSVSTAVLTDTAVCLRNQKRNSENCVVGFVDKQKKEAQTGSPSVSPDSSVIFPEQHQSSPISPDSPEAESVDSGQAYSNHSRDSETKTIHQKTGDHFCQATCHAEAMYGKNVYCLLQKTEEQLTVMKQVLEKMSAEKQMLKEYEKEIEDRLLRLKSDIDSRFMAIFTMCCHKVWEKANNVSLCVLEEEMAAAESAVTRLLLFFMQDTEEAVKLKIASSGLLLSDGDFKRLHGYLNKSVRRLPSEFFTYSPSEKTKTQLLRQIPMVVGEIMLGQQLLGTSMRTSEERANRAKDDRAPLTEDCPSEKAPQTDFHTKHSSKAGKLDHRAVHRWQATQDLSVQTSRFGACEKKCHTKDQMSEIAEGTIMPYEDIGGKVEDLTKKFSKVELLAASFQNEQTVLFQDVISLWGNKDALAAEIDYLHKQSAALIAKVDSATSVNNGISKGIFSLESKYKNLQEIVAGIQNRHKQLNQDLSAIKGDKDKVHKDIAAVQKNNTKHYERLGSLQTNISTLQKDLATVQQKDTQVDKAITKLKAEVSRIQQHFLDVQKDHSEMLQDLAIVQADTTKLHQGKVDADKQNIQIHEGLGAVRKDNIEVRQNLKQLREEFFRMKQKSDAFTSDIQKAVVQENTKVHQGLLAAQQEITKLSQSLASVREDSAILRQDLITVRQMEKGSHQRGTDFAPVRTELNKLQHELGQLQTTFAKFQMESRSRHKNVETLPEKFAALKAENDRISKELQALRTETEKMASLQSEHAKITKALKSVRAENERTLALFQAEKNKILQKLEKPENKTDIEYFKKDRERLSADIAALQKNTWQVHSYLSWLEADLRNCITQAHVHKSVTDSAAPEQMT